MNQYLKNLNKIEFVVTNACTGKCKHCSEGDHDGCGTHIDADVAADAVRKIAGAYDIKTVMTFGGEPLLYPDAVYAIIGAATELEIARRQVITNGYFSQKAEKVSEVAKRLASRILLKAFAVDEMTIFGTSSVSSAIASSNS